MQQNLQITTGKHHGRALDQAIDMLGAALRAEREESQERRARVLRSRLCRAERTTLRDRMLTTPR